MAALTDSDALNIMQTFLRYRVLPLILAPHHHTGGGHYHAVRLADNKAFVEWTEDGPNGEDMFYRVQEACAELIYIPPAQEPVSLTTANRTPTDGSAYSPSGSSLVELSYSGSEVISQPINPVQLASLYQHLNPHGRHRGDMTVIWRQVETKNFNAFQLWEHPHPSADSVVPSSGPDSIIAECRRYATHPEIVTSLLRSLPYPEVALYLLPSDLACRLSQELLIRSHAELLRTVKATVTSQEILDSIECWLLEVAAEDPLEIRWAKSANLELWQHTSTLVGNPDLLGQRSLPQTDDDAWFKLFFCLVVMTKTREEFDRHCLRIHGWIKANAERAQAALERMRSHDWTKLVHVIEGYGTSDLVSADPLQGGPVSC